MSYRYLFSSPRGEHSADQLIDTMVELLVRLHLAGIFWGDCSLSNTLFRPDAGTLSAYLVDAETVERHPSLSPGQRTYDVDLATGARGGELMDLAAGGLLPTDIDPIEVADSLPDAVRGAVGRGDPRGGLPPDEQRYRDRRTAAAAQRARLRRRRGGAGHLPEAASKLRVQTRVAEPGQHRRELFRLTGLEVQEHQARRLLNDLRGFRAWLEQQRRRGRCPETFAGAPLGGRGLPAGGRRDPAGPAGRLAPAEVFHEILEHRWFLSEQAGRDVGTTEAAALLLRHRAAPDPQGGHHAVGHRGPDAGELARRPHRERRSTALAVTFGSRSADPRGFELTPPVSCTTLRRPR